MDYNLAMNPTSLGQLDKLPVGLTLEGMEWMNRARDMDVQRQADLPSLISHEARMRPLRETQMDAGNQTTLANLPGLQAQSKMLQRKNQMEEMTFDDTVKAKLRELALKSSEDDIKALGLQGEKLLYSNDPQERYQGQRILSASKAMYEAMIAEQRAKEKSLFEHGLKLKEIEAQNAGRIAAANARPGKSEADIISKLGYEKAVVYYEALADDAEQRGEADKATALRQKADMYAKEVQKKAAAVVRPGTVDPSQFGVQTMPTQPPAGLERKDAPPKTQYTKGQVYTGKTGKYEYLGGDEKDPKSWKKVQ